LSLPPPHGFGDDERSRHLRNRPPADALRWVEASLRAKVRSARACRGGISSAIHVLRVEGHDGLRSVILRRYVMDELNVEEPDIAVREARTLRLLERADTPTPQLLALDATGDLAGVPSVLMTRVPGRLDWSPVDLDPWLHRLAMVLVELHDAPITAADGVQPFAPYAPESWEPPHWLSNERLWERALQVFHGPRLDLDDVFIHRDYHPGNVLWLRRQVSGVVDWQAASIGPRSVDVWHCRGNLLSRFGLDVCDRFLDVWRSASGHPYHPWAEAVMLVDAIGWLQPRRPQEQRDLELLLATRLAELGA
jgi:aminoglycoside phosphotransferase (APT) family kinase protein